jgi:hypothetical protein
MITQDTAATIWAAYREIAAAEKLLADMEAERAKPFGDREKHAATLKDAFGQRQHLQLGIPSGENGHRLFQVSPQLGESVIRAHIAHQKASLAVANEQARIELAMTAET